MVQKTGINRFMDLQKPNVTPHEWVKEIDVKWFEDEVSWLKYKKSYKHYLMTYDYTKHTFYELYDLWEQREKSFKIYHILDKQYWVVEVTK